MSKVSIPVLITTLMFTLTGCERGQVDRVEKEPSNNQSQQVAPAAAIMSRSLAVADERCGNGGVQVDLGFDLNSNGVLDDAEVTNSELICNGVDGKDGANGKDGKDGVDGSNGQDGADGQNGQPGKDGVTTLIAVTDESAGIHCRNGGVKVDVGPDNNSDAVLNATEIAQTKYICNGEDGSDGRDGSSSGSRGPAGQNGVDGENGLNTLVKVIPESAGLNCANGGQRITAGLDSNRNNILEEAEITSGSYICNGRNGSGSGVSNSLTISNPIVLEGDKASFAVTLNDPSQAATEFYYSTLSSSAKEGEDYLLSAGKLVFQPGEVSKTVVVQTLKDTQFENNELFMLQVSGFGENLTAFAEITQPAFVAQPLTVQTNANGNALVGTNVVIELSDQINEIAGDGIVVTSADGAVVLGEANYAFVDGKPTLSFTPSASLALGTTYTVAVKPVTTMGLSEAKNLAEVSFTTESQAYAYRNASVLPLQGATNLWQWLEEGTAREIKAGNAPLTFAGNGIEFNGQYFFAGSVVTDATQADSQLYVSDGSSHGTRLLTDEEGAAIATNPGNFTVFNGELYFTANDATGTEQQLWKTDGTAANTVAIAGTEAAEISELTVAGEALYYVVDQSGVPKLWSVNASNEALQLVENGLISLSNLTPFQGQLYFIAEMNTFVDEELYRLTTGGVELAVETNGVNKKSSDFQNLQVIGEQLFFTAEPDNGGRFAYSYDGVTASQTVNQDGLAASNSTAQLGADVFILSVSGESYLRAASSEQMVAVFNSTSGLISTPAGVVVAGDFNGTQGLWLFTDATPLENGATPTVAVEMGNITLEGLVGDMLLYSVKDSSNKTTYYLTDLVTLDADTQEVKVIEVKNERVVL
ncbi:DUF7151 family protein [Salinibius halmophilus]|uniref:DUF7151 family protein n=1 Tax=Salinibius halmophilus TaxID=1853216 RepID=UPI001313EACE|nr:Calx-beta domain-containing protein [Salinibius halmophilus]